MALLERHRWRIAVAAVVLTVCPLGPNPSALAAFLDPATAVATLATGTLQPPTNLSTTACVLGFTVMWTASAGPITPTGYEVQWKLSTSGSYTDSATTAGTSYAIGGLSVLNTYNVRVRAYLGANWTSVFAGPVSRFCPL